MVEFKFFHPKREIPLEDIIAREEDSLIRFCDLFSSIQPLVTFKRIEDDPVRDVYGIGGLTVKCLINSYYALDIVLYVGQEEGEDVESVAFQPIDSLTYKGSYSDDQQRNELDVVQVEKYQKFHRLLGGYNKAFKEAFEANGIDLLIETSMESDSEEKALQQGIDILQERPYPEYPSTDIDFLDEDGEENKKNLRAAIQQFATNIQSLEPLYDELLHKYGMQELKNE